MENASSNRGRHIALRPIQRLWDPHIASTIAVELKAAPGSARRHARRGSRRRGFGWPLVMRRYSAKGSPPGVGFPGDRSLYGSSRASRTFLTVQQAGGRPLEVIHGAQSSWRFRPHFHAGDEIVRLLAGRARLRLQSSCREVVEGETVVVPAGMVHRFEPVDDEGWAFASEFVLRPGQHAIGWFCRRACRGWARQAGHAAACRPPQPRDRCRIRLREIAPYRRAISRVRFAARPEQACTISTSCWRSTRPRHDCEKVLLSQRPPSMAASTIRPISRASSCGHSA